MRLIDADALKGVFVGEYPGLYTKKYIKNLIDGMPTVEMPGWVSVEDRLPEREGLYLCWTVFNGEACYQIHLWKDGRWYWVHDVRYWMPLPEPPEEVGGDG